MKGFRLVKNGNCRKMEIDPQKKYQILSGVSHVYVRAGKLSLFQSDFFSISGEREDVKTRRGLFFAVPFGAKFVEFPEFYKNPGGYHYGLPSWHAVKTC